MDDALISDDDLMTAAEVAKMLKRDRRTIYRDVREGIIPFMRVGGRLLFSRTDLSAWLRSHRHTPTPPPAPVGSAVRVHLPSHVPTPTYSASSSSSSPPRSS